MKQSEALDMITKIQLAHQAMESACKRVDELKEENKNLKEALAKQEQGEPVGFCKVLTMDDVADIIVNAQSETPPYEISYMTVMQLTEKAVLEKFK